MSRRPLAPPPPPRCFQLLMLTEVCSDRLMPFRISLQKPEERAPHTSTHCFSLCLARAPTAGSKHEEGHVEPCGSHEELPAAVLLAVLQRCASIMFSGETGAVVTSAEGRATSVPSYALVKDAITVVEALSAWLSCHRAAVCPAHGDTATFCVGGGSAPLPRA